MVRRRTASPKPSAPVRSASPRSTSSAHAPPPSAAPPRPAASQLPPPGMGAAPSQGPGLFGQMAATAGGVAIGSAVGHTIGHMMTGGGGSREEAPAQSAPAGAPQQQYSNPCEFEWKQFLECSQSQSDLSLCNAFMDQFKTCKARYAQ